MKFGFYPKLALDGIRKNKQLYIPYILASAGMVMMFYIITFIKFSKPIQLIPGASNIAIIMGLGSFIIAIFACIFLFYTNSFLIKRRKKEFGLYNILGMGKRHISVILLWENLFIYVISIVLGLIFGIAFSKFAELGLINIIGEKINYSFYVSPDTILFCICIFAAIFFLIYLNELRQIKFSNAISLLRSENAGEKPPKANWLIGILGFVILIAAYITAISIKNSFEALNIFFLAVILVIIATYMIMISGSVLLCRILQKRKNYYYKSNHFISVSSMMYRMKRNGAGLASICILSTMVLVMLSSTSSLFFGKEDSLMSRYPREINTEYSMSGIDKLSDENFSAMKKEIFENYNKNGYYPQNVIDFRYLSATGIMQDGNVNTNPAGLEYAFSSSGDICQILIIPLSDYNRLMNKNEVLAPNEAIIYTTHGHYGKDKISIDNSVSFDIVKKADSFVDNGESAMSAFMTITLFVPDIEASFEGISSISVQLPNIVIDFDLNDNIAVKDYNTLQSDMVSLFHGTKYEEKYGFHNIYFELREINRKDFYSTYGGLFYLGIILSIAFILATALIMYYKQISEGYEDMSRFDIMQKVGISKKAIKKSINSQLLTVFFIPLLFAGLHIVFAFPMIKNMLLMFNLRNTASFVFATVITYLLFTLLYIIIYKITTNAYYKIVSGAKEK